MARTISENRAPDMLVATNNYEPHRRCGEATTVTVEAHHDGEVQGVDAVGEPQPGWQDRLPGSGSPCPASALMPTRSRKYVDEQHEDELACRNREQEIRTACAACRDGDDPG